MPFASINGTRLYYEDTGGTGVPVVFSHGLLWSCRMFDAQVHSLAAAGYRCIAYDHRGQGQSDRVRVRSVTIEQCYEDAITLIEHINPGRCHFVGLSMGGFVAMRLGSRRPDLVRSISLLETSCDAEPRENIPGYNRLKLIWRVFGPAPVARPVMQIMFSSSFLADPAHAAERAEQLARLKANRRDIWRAVNGVIERAAVCEELRDIHVPTLIIVGEEDVATVPAKAEKIHSLIPGSTLVRIPRAGHTSSVEQPELVTRALLSHITTLGA